MTTATPPQAPPISEFIYREIATNGSNHRNRAVMLPHTMPPGTVDGYYSWQQFDYTFLEWLRDNPNEPAREDGGKRRTMKGWGTRPEHWGFTEWLYLDIDAPVLADAIEKTRNVVHVLESRYGIDPNALRIWFSGSKGSGLAIPTSLFGGLPPLQADHLAKVARAAVGWLLGDFRRYGIDDSLYQPGRLLRAEGTIHSTTGLYRTPITAWELFNLDIAAITDLARTPRTIERADPDDWNAIAELEAALQDIIARPATPKSERTRRGPAGERELTDEQIERIIEQVADSLPDAGERHPALLALTGGLLGSGVSEETTAYILAEIAIRAMPNGEGERRKAAGEFKRMVETTAAKLKAGDPTTGWSRYAQHVSDQARDDLWDVIGISYSGADYADEELAEEDDPATLRHIIAELKQELAKAERQIEREHDRGDRYRRRAVGLVRKLRHQRTKHGEADRQLVQLQRLQSLQSRVIRNKNLTPATRLVAAKIANLLESHATSGPEDGYGPDGPRGNIKGRHRESGEAIRIYLSEPQPGDYDYRPEKSGYSLAAQCGISPKTAARARDELVKAGLIDSGDPSNKKAAERRSTYLLVPDDGGSGHPGLVLLERAEAYEPEVPKEKPAAKVRETSKPLCAEHPESDVEVTKFCVEGQHEIDRYIARPRGADSASGQNVPLGNDDGSLDGQNVHSDTAGETPVPDAFHRAFAGWGSEWKPSENETLISFCSQCRKTTVAKRLGLVEWECKTCGWNPTRLRDSDAAGGE